MKTQLFEEVARPYIQVTTAKITFSPNQKSFAIAAQRFFNTARDLDQYLGVLERVDRDVLYGNNAVDLWCWLHWLKEHALWNPLSDWLERNPNDPNLPVRVTFQPGKQGVTTSTEGDVAACLNDLSKRLQDLAERCGNMPVKKVYGITSVTKLSVLAPVHLAIHVIFEHHSFSTLNNFIIQIQNLLGEDWKPLMRDSADAPFGPIVFALSKKEDDNLGKHIKPPSTISLRLVKLAAKEILLTGTTKILVTGCRPLEEHLKKAHDEQLLEQERQMYHDLDHRYVSQVIAWKICCKRGFEPETEPTGPE